MSGLSLSTIREIVRFVAWWARPTMPEPKPVVEARKRVAIARRRRNSQQIGWAQFGVYAARHDALRQELARRKVAK